MSNFVRGEGGFIIGIAHGQQHHHQQHQPLHQLQQFPRHQRQQPVVAPHTQQPQLHQLQQFQYVQAQETHRQMQAQRQQQHQWLQQPPMPALLAAPMPTFRAAAESCPADLPKGPQRAREDVFVPRVPVHVEASEADPKVSAYAGPEQRALQPDDKGAVVAVQGCADRCASEAAVKGRRRSEKHGGKDGVAAGRGSGHRGRSEAAAKGRARWDAESLDRAAALAGAALVFPLVGAAVAVPAAGVALLGVGVAVGACLVGSPDLVEALVGAAAGAAGSAATEATIMHASVGSVGSDGSDDWQQ
jgi:hypothetical protein